MPEPVHGHAPSPHVGLISLPDLGEPVRQGEWWAECEKLATVPVSTVLKLTSEHFRISMPAPPGKPRPTEDVYGTIVLCGKGKITHFLYVPLPAEWVQTMLIEAGWLGESADLEDKDITFLGGVEPGP